MAWQRFNRTTNVFEVSDNNGASWQTLVIAAAGVGVTLPPNIAYRNIDNAFVAQTFAAYSVVSGPNLALYLRDTSSPAGQQEWRFISYSNGQLHLEGMDGTGGAAVRFSFERGNTLSLANLYATGTINGVTTINSGTSMNVGSSLNVGTSIVAGGNIHTRNGAYLYPGRFDVGADGGIQGSWMLSSHGSYGLYINTGLYIEHYIWPLAVEARAHMRAVSDVYAGQGFFEYGRSFRQGEWVGAGIPGISTNAGATIGWGNVQLNNFCMVGRMLIWNFAFVNMNMTADCNIIYVNLPAGLVNATYGWGQAWGHFNAPRQDATVGGDPGTGYIGIYNKSQQYFPAGTYHIYGFAILQVQ